MSDDRLLRIDQITVGPRHRRDLGDVDGLRAMPNFENSGPALASQGGAPVFERPDWSLFRTLEGLQQRAGVPAPRLALLVLKELADNGLDLGAKVTVEHLGGSAYAVTDDGPGIEEAAVARLFSIDRPMLSTKLIRLPTRGALGNGLRVVASAVLVSGGSLTVITRNRAITLRPERDGSTRVTSSKAVKFPVGTKVEITFGDAVPCAGNTIAWADIARHLAAFGTQYSGKSSPHWYDPRTFHELLYASGERPVRDLIASLDGCTGGTAGEIVREARAGRAGCRDLSFAQASRLLAAARANARPVKPARLGAVGAAAFPRFAYAVAYGTAQFGASPPAAEIPYVVEAWVGASASATSLNVCVNRTPVTGSIRGARDKRAINAHGCGLHHTIASAPAERQFNIWINVTTPYMPITSDGKAPDLEPFVAEIAGATMKAVRKARRPDARAEATSQKDVVLDHLDAVIAEVSGVEGYRFNARQLFYALRPIVMTETGEELKIGNFTGIITDYEAEHGEIPLMYREPRGSITHPHRGETITLGTLMVEEYKRPAWNFNKVLYIEKEGAQEALKQNRWLERHDCAVMSSKGFSTRAARDLIDKLVEHDEPVTVFCAHDADASGTLIYQTLQEETRARAARKVRIINLGLEPWEALDLDLEVETIAAGDRRRPIADYVGAHAGDWEEWLQTHRVELNAMTTPQLIEWLDQKMADYGDGKLIPPQDVIAADLQKRIEAKVRAALTEHILREASLDDQVAAAVAAIEMPGTGTVVLGIRATFERTPEREWRDHVETVAAGLAACGCAGFEHIAMTDDPTKPTTEQ